VRSAVLRGFTTFYRRKTWRPELEPARVAEFPQPAHKTRAPNTEQFTACTLRIAPNNSEPFIVLHGCLHPVERIQRRAVRRKLERSSSISPDSVRLWCWRMRLREGWFLGGERLLTRVSPQRNRMSCALLAGCCGENEALIVDLLDWKKFQVRLIVYFPNRYCRRRYRRRDGNFRRRPASSRVQPKTYRHPGEPGGNAYDRASH